MDIVLIITPLKDYDHRLKLTKSTLPVLGLGYIATAISEAGFNVEVLDAEALGLGISEIHKHIAERNPNWIGLNLLAPTYENSVKILGKLPKKTRVMLGGHQAKAMPQDILCDNRIPRIDALIVGEAETRAVELLRNPNRANELPNVFNRKSCDTLILSNKEKIHWLSPDINSLPYVNRDFLPNDPFLAEDGRWEAKIVGSRGCPFDCSFCGAAVSANPDITIRMRTVEHIIGEMKHLNATYGCTAFRFVDDLFLANPRFMRRIFEGFVESSLHKRIIWDATGRLNVIDKMDNEFVALMKKAGCREVALGIESGSDRLLEYIDKKLSREQILRSVKKLLDHGINIKGYFILGFPTETADELDMTLSLVEELWQMSDLSSATFRCSVFEFRPYPGTPEWNRLLETGAFKKEQLLSLDHAAIEVREERDQFSFSTNIQFSEVPLKEVRRHVSEIMNLQSDRISRNAL